MSVSIVTIIALTAYKRIEAVSDEGSFQEFDKGMTSANPLDFPGYEEKLKKINKRQIYRKQLSLALQH